MPKPQRIQLRRVKGWRMPPDTVKVARPSRWGNPYVIGGWFGISEKKLRMLVMCKAGEMRINSESEVWVTREISLLLYENQMEQFPDEHFYPLFGQNVACFCPLTEACHGDYLLHRANQNYPLAGLLP